MRDRQQDFIHDDIETKLDGLIQQMTVAEKVGQITQISPSLFGAFDMGQIIQQLVDGHISIQEFEAMPRDYHEQEIREGLLGSLGGITDPEKANELQRIAVEESRLGIPLLFGFDVIHGFKTVFPIPLAESCAWDPELARRTAAVAAREASAAGINWTFAPMVDIARDPRWGRIAEGAGEDTYLGSLMAAARVQGFQGEDLKHPETVLACTKHYAAYGAAVGGRDYNTTDMSLQTLHDVYLPPFEAASRAGAATFMCAFNDVNGVPCSANTYLLSDVLRDRFGFRGFVVSDANSIPEVVVHGYAADDREASGQALKAGVEVDMSQGTYRKHIPELLADGTLDEAVLDEAVRRILRVKYRMGLFQNPYRTTPKRAAQDMMTPEHIALAREAACKSIVLLKNASGTLPMTGNVRRIALVGPLADSKADLLGSWAGCGEPGDVISVLEGIANRGEHAPEVLRAKGCELLGDDVSGFAQAVEAAKASDIILAVVGESPEMSGEAGSRMSLDLPGKQEALLRALKETGKPLVVVLINGRPLALPWLQEHADAIVEAWQPGTQGGNAIADVLFGDVNPSGKLTTTFPHAVGQVPIHYNHPRTGRPAGKIRFTSKYVDGPVEPLYPFGHGLSYTTFQYGALRLHATELSIGDVLKVEADITNTGTVPGEEIVQLYISDLVASRVRPVKELKGFRKITLQPGETRTVRFVVDTHTLGFHDEHLCWTVEPGVFRVMVGPSSDQGLEMDFSLL